MRLVREMGGELVYRHQVSRTPDGMFVWDPDIEPSAPFWLRNAIGEDYFRTVDQVSINVQETQVTMTGLKILKSSVPSLDLFMSGG